MKTKKILSVWNRKLWGVVFLDKDKNSYLIGDHWDFRNSSPTRALLFYTREAARWWCRWENQKCKNRTDFCSAWRFYPVQVLEVVKFLNF